MLDTANTELQDVVAYQAMEVDTGTESGIIKVRVQDTSGLGNEAVVSLKFDPESAKTKVEEARLDGRLVQAMQFLLDDRGVEIQARAVKLLELLARYHPDFGATASIRSDVSEDARQAVNVTLAEETHRIVNMMPFGIAALTDDDIRLQFVAAGLVLTKDHGPGKSSADGPADWNSVLKAFRKVIRDFKTRSGMTNAQIERNARMCRGRLGTIERGSQDPRKDEIIRMARLIGVRPSDIHPDLARLDGQTMESFFNHGHGLEVHLKFKDGKQHKSDVKYDVTSDRMIELYRAMERNAP